MRLLQGSLDSNPQDCYMAIWVIWLPLFHLCKQMEVTKLATNEQRKCKDADASPWITNKEASSKSSKSWRLWQNEERCNSSSSFHVQKAQWRSQTNKISCPFRKNKWSKHDVSKLYQAHGEIEKTNTQFRSKSNWWRWKSPVVIWWVLLINKKSFIFNRMWHPIKRPSAYWRFEKQSRWCSCSARLPASLKQTTGSKPLIFSKVLRPNPKIHKQIKKTKVLFANNKATLSKMKTYQIWFLQRWEPEDLLAWLN